MYNGSQEVRQGLRKNLFGVFDHRLGKFLFAWGWIWLVFVYPLIALAVMIFVPGIAEAAMPLSIISIACSFIIWAVILWRFRYPWYSPFLYPVIVSVSFFLGISSVFAGFSKNATWKGRSTAVGENHVG